MRPAFKLLIISISLLTYFVVFPLLSDTLAETCAVGPNTCINSSGACVQEDPGQCADSNGNCAQDSTGQCTDSNGNCASGTPDSGGACINQTPTPTPIGMNNIDPFLNLENTFGNFLAAIPDFTVGISPMGESLQYVRDSSTGKATAYVYQHSPTGGALGTLAMLTGSMYDNPPASTTTYLASLGSQLGIVNPAYAAGVGGSGAGVIEPILSIWQFMRNVAYLLYIALFVAVGFMIMFRQKINPQTVISVQAALPGLIIGLILITFSYLIAAFAIDLSFLGVQLVAQPFISAGNNALGDLKGLASNPNLLNIFGHSAGAAWSNAGSIKDALGNLNLGGGGLGIQTLITGAGGLVTGCLAGLVGGLVGAAVGCVVGGGAGAAAPALLSLLIPAIISIALIVQFLRLFLKLVEAYLSLLVDTMLGPLIIMAGSLPGRGKSITNWFKSLIANSLVFPAVFGAVLFAGLILGVNTQGAWTSTPPLFGGLQPDIVRIILGFGVLLALPSIPDTVKGAFGVKPLPQGQEAIGGFLAGAALGRLGTQKFVTQPAINAMASGLRGKGSWGTKLSDSLGRTYGRERWYRGPRTPGESAPIEEGGRS